MPTPNEQKALLFLGAVALLGGAVRLFDGTPPAEATPAEREGLARQVAAVEGAAAADRAERSGKKGRGPKGDRKQRSTGGEGAVPGRSPTRQSLARRGPVDVDRATLEELETLPGVGPALAARIVADRASKGAFGSLAALDQVSGIGPTLINRLTPHVTFSASPRPSNANGSGGGAPRASRVVGLIGGRP